MLSATHFPWIVDTEFVDMVLSYYTKDACMPEFLKARTIKCGLGDEVEVFGPLSGVDVLRAGSARVQSNFTWPRTAGRIITGVREVCWAGFEHEANTEQAAGITR